jgi:hypothetical protein
MEHPWQIKEKIGMGINNPRDAMRIVLPENWTTKQREDFLEAVKNLVPDQENDYDLI